MKKSINKEKLLETVGKRREVIIVVAGVLLLALTAFATYKAINPGMNDESVVKGEAKLKSLNIQFDNKTLKDIKEEKAPSVINGPSGRNPFTPL
jgi:hypothetical protein